MVMLVGSTLLVIFAFREIGSENESGWASLWPRFLDLPLRFRKTGRVGCGGARETSLSF